MQRASRRTAFTIIELLTVIAIIAVLAAILFPLAGTVREQARQGSCLTKLHQLYVSLSVYKQDEGAFPPVMLGWVEAADPNDPTGKTSSGSYLLDPNAQAPVPADRIIAGFLYREQIRNIEDFKCPNNFSANKSDITVAYLPPRPTEWPAYPNSVARPWIAERVAQICPNAEVSGVGTLDVFTDGPDLCKPRYYYRWNSFDLGPRIGPDGNAVRDGNGNLVYDRHYSTDWTGVTGATDLPIQLKYERPDGDKTILTYCTWHGATGNNVATAILLSGSAKKVKLEELAKHGPNVFNR